MTSSARQSTKDQTAALLDASECFAQVMTPNYAPMAMMPAHGEGVYLWDTAGKRYLDFAGGIAVSALGHANPELVAVLTEQANKFWHVSNVFTNEPALALAGSLIRATFAERVFLANSGAEVNEAALKLARRYAVDHFTDDKFQLLAFNESFHGRTFFTVCVGGQKQYSDGFGPKPAGISHLPFNDVQGVHEYFATYGDRVCAVIVEPCQGEGGVTPATPGFLRALRQQCDTHQALLIFDEVQIGMGRSGTLYAYEQSGVTPDILTTAKALGCGFPISAMLTTEKIAASLTVGTHGSTFGGNPMACAVAGKVLELINSPPLLGNVQARHRQLLDGLQAINEELRVFKDIRGMGLLLGCELRDEYAGKARDIMTKGIEHGLLTLMAGANVLRLAPPLILSADQTQEGLEIIRASIADGLSG